MKKRTPTESTLTDPFAVGCTSSCIHALHDTSLWTVGLVVASDRIPRHANHLRMDRECHLYHGTLEGHGGRGRLG